MTELNDLVFDSLRAEGYEDLESISLAEQRGDFVYVNINLAGFRRIEGIQIPIAHLIAFVYSRCKPA